LIKKNVGGDDQRSCAFTDRGRKSGIEIAYRCGAHADNAHASIASGRLRLFQLQGRVTGAQQHGHSRNLRRKIVQQANSLAGQIGAERRNACEIAPWTVQACDEPGSDRIGAAVEYNRDGCGRVFCGVHRVGIGA